MLTGSALTLYSIGEPTDEEQLYLESINRARRDPAGEGLRLQASQDPKIVANYEAFSVDLALMAAQMAALPPAQPLSMNARLMESARAHSQDMFVHEFQAHDGWDGSTFGERATAHGYTWIGIAENIYAHAESVAHGHAGFEVDWGGDASTGGMQEPPGHRLNIHAPDFREVGIGVVQGLTKQVGPQLVTQDFGLRQGLSPFLTGVVYYDFNGNAAYDVGEGVGGVAVTTPGSVFYAVSAAAGGYSLPVPGSGDYTVTFRVAGIPDAQSTVTVGTENVKLDHQMSYTPATISGPDQPAVQQENIYAFTAVGAASGYQWKSSRLVPFTQVEGAEGGLANVIATLTPGYAVVDPVIHATGKNSFHLAHPRIDGTNSPPEDQFLVINRTFRGRSIPALNFASRLSWATTSQVARAQISLNGGNTWQDVWSQAGTGGAGETGFGGHVIQLPEVSDREFRLRFVYDYVTGGFFFDTATPVGFHLDDIALTGVDELQGEVITDLPISPSFAFVPAATDSYALSVRARISSRVLPWGPAKVVTARIVSGPGLVRIGSVQSLADGRVQIDFTVANPGAGGYQVQESSDPAGPWLGNALASVQPINGGAAYRALVPAPASAYRFYRLLAN